MTVLACDLGGTRMKLGIVRHGELVSSKVLPADGTMAANLPRIQQALLQQCARLGIEPGDCAGVGMGFPSLVDSQTGRVLDEFGKYPGAPRLDLNAWAAEGFGLPLAIDNDARVALLGEWRCGAGRGSDNLAIVTLGTGVGTAVISEGRMLRGPHFHAGNLCGHLVVNPDGAECCCGGWGCIEAETGSARLATRARELPGFDDSPLAEVDRIDYEAVCRLAPQGDPVSQGLLRHAIDIWAILCVDLIHAFDVDRIVVGGGVIASADLILPPLREIVARRTIPSAGRVDIVPAAQPDYMGLLGCEPLVKEKCQRHGRH